MAKIFTKEDLDIEFPLTNPPVPKGCNSLADEDAFINYERKSKIIDYLKEIDYGDYEAEIYDCEDRAFWGIAHVRHMYPGFPIGMAQGKAQPPYYNNEDHALIILWYRIGRISKYTYFDQESLEEIAPSDGIFGKDQEFLDIVIGFPDDKTGKGFKPLPFPSLTQIKGRKSIGLDFVHEFYPKEDLIDYLVNQTYEKHCLGIAPDGKLMSHGTMDPLNFDVYWKSNPDDKALWAYAHLKRKFLGAPVGLALGNKNSTIFIIYKDNGKQQTVYWDFNGEVKDFDAKLILI